MEQQIAMLLQQVMEVSERLRQNEESSEQVRQLLEAHRTVGQLLEERMTRTEVSVRDTSQAGGNSAGAFAARYQPENFNGEDAGWRGLGCFVPGQDGFNEDECKISTRTSARNYQMSGGTTWR